MTVLIHVYNAPVAHKYSLLQVQDCCQLRPHICACSGLSGKSVLRRLAADQADSINCLMDHMIIERLQLRRPEAVSCGLRRYYTLLKMVLQQKHELKIEHCRHRSKITSHVTFSDWRCSYRTPGKSSSGLRPSVPI